jgi:hypothetical protein
VLVVPSTLYHDGGGHMSGRAKGSPRGDELLGLRRTREAGVPLTGDPPHSRRARRAGTCVPLIVRAMRDEAPRGPGALGREDLDRRVTRGEAPGGDVVTRPDAGKWKPTAVPDRGPLV